MSTDDLIPQSGVPGDRIGGDKIQGGDISSSVAAIGAGAKVIYTNVERALSQVEVQEKAYEYERQQLAEALTRYVQRLENQAQLAREDPGYGNPYKALLEYDIQDAALFYGRSAATRDLLAHLERDQLTVLHAESGVGKTSLLKAGIMSRLLAEGHVPLYLRPYQTPVHTALKRSLLIQMHETPNLAQSSLHDFLRRVTDMLGGKQIIVIVDQFEEFFTEQSEEARIEFIEQLSPCLDDDLLPVKWVLVLRNEWFGQLGTLRPHIRNPYANEYLLSPLTSEESRRVIIEPASRRGVSFEPRLVERLIDDLGRDEIVPPHLQLVCSLLFDELKGRSKITQTMYEEAGGAKGILRGHLNRVLSRDVPREKRQAARVLLEALVTSQKRRALRSYEDLAVELEISGIGRDLVDEVIDYLVESRLLRVEEISGTGVGGAIAYELAHDYLLEEIEIDPAIQTRKAAQELISQKLPFYKREGLLLSAEELEIVKPQRQWLHLTGDAAKLVQESENKINRQRRITISAVALALILVVGLALTTAIIQARSANNQARSANEKAILLNTAVAANELAGVRLREAESARGEAELQRNQAQSERNRAEFERSRAEEEELTARSRELAARVNLDLQAGDLINAYRHAFQAYRTDQTFESKNALFIALSFPLPKHIITASREDAWSSRFSPDGGKIVTAYKDGTARITDAADGSELMVLEGPENSPLYFASFSPDGSRVVTAGRDGAVRVWDAESGEKILLLEGHQDWVRTANFSPDGKLIVTASKDGTARLWDAENGQLLKDFQEHEGFVLYAEFSPSGRQIVSSDEEGNVLLWDVETGSILKRLLSAHEDRVNSAVFSPDGALMITTSDDDSAKVWDVETEKELFSIDHADDVNFASFSPDGVQIITASDDRTSKLINIDDDTEIILKGHTDQVNSAIISPDGELIVTASHDGTVWIRETTPKPEFLTIDDHADEVTNANFSHDGSKIVTASEDLTVRVWDIDTGNQLVAIPNGHEDDINSAEFSADDSKILTASDDSWAKIWDAESGKELMALGGDGENKVNFASYSEDGSLIVAAGGDMRAILWDSTTGKKIGEFIGHTQEVNCANFSRDGTRIVTASDDETARVWDVQNGEEIVRLEGHEGDVQYAAFSPDGTLVVTAGDDKTVRLWDAESGTEVKVFSGHTDAANYASFNEDGSLIITASDDGTMHLWDVASHARLTILEGHRAGVNSALFNPESSWILSASDDKTARLWSLEFERLIQIMEEKLAQLGVPIEEQ